MTYVFNTGAELLACCREEGIPIHEAMIRRELELGDLGRNDLREEMQRNLTVMRASVEKGLEDAPRSVSGLSGGDAQKLDAYQDKALLGKTAVQAADLVLAGVSSVIPFDEAVSAMRSVGKALPLDLRETARGGLAATPTGRRIAEGLN